MEGNLFSEQWYKVASLHLKLNTNTYIKKQLYRGEEWYIIEDRYNNQFFKVRPEAYRFLARLDGLKSVGEVWEESLRVDGDTIPTQDEVIRLLTALHHKNLLSFKNRADSQELMIREKRRRQKEFFQKVISFLYFKIPLIDPDHWLESFKLLCDRIFSKWGLILWIIALMMGVREVVTHFSLLYDQTQSILSLDNFIWLYVAIVILKIFHELGHACMIKKFGGSVHQMGVMLLVFTPLPYVEASSSWSFRSKYERALVGAAGMIVEIFFASIAALIWAHSGDGVLHNLAFNIMLLGSISTIMFNGNPLLRFDAYFILSDLLEIPNLYERARKELAYFFEKYILRIKTQPASKSLKESLWLYLYAFLSFFYKLLVSIGISLYVADQWFLLGVVSFIVSFSMWFLYPLFRYIYSLFVDMKYKKYRLRTVSVITLLSLLITAFVTMIPLPLSIKLPGLLLHEGYYLVHTKSGGYLRDIYVQNGEYVQKGEKILLLQNKQLDIDIEQTKSHIAEVKVYILQALSNSKADIAPLKESLELLKKRLAYLEEKRSNLLIRAQKSGYFVYNHLEGLRGSWIKKGEEVGNLIPKGDVYFDAIVLQENANYIFGKKSHLKASLKLYGEAKEEIPVTSLNVVPYQKDILPSPALGWMGGGDIPVDQKNPQKTLEPFFELRVNILSQNSDISFFQGRRGLLKVEVGSMTLLERFFIRFRQIFQKRYRI